MGKGIHRHSLAWDLLRVLGGVAILASVLVAPNIGLALKPFLRRANFREEREWRRTQVRLALERLRARRLIRFVEKGKRTYIEITELGKRRLREFDFDSLAIERPKRWDGKWRIVIFDIPEKRQRERRSLRMKLSAVGFYQLQKSVWVYPFACPDEVDFICNFLDIDRWVHYIETNSLAGAEGKVRHHFNLLV